MAAGSLWFDCNFIIRRAAGNFNKNSVFKKSAYFKKSGTVLHKESANAQMDFVHCK